MDKEQKVENVFRKFHELHGEYSQLWLEETFLHWDWWLALILALGTWVFWFFYREKKSTHRLLYAGISVILISLCLDYIGIAMGLWFYTGKINPSFPAWIPFNFCLLPVAVMFLIQTKPHIDAWKKAAFFSLITSFLGEPLFEWIGFYIPTGWKSIYSVPIYFLIFLFANWLTKRESFSRECCR